jgi:hypothetical protein
VPTDLGARILEGPALESRDLLGQHSALVSAAQGRAFVLEVAGGRPTARALKTSAPVYKAFGLNASGGRLAYRPVVGDTPSGDLVIEDVATGTSRRITSHYVLEAAWSPRDRNLLAITFANGHGYGLALFDTRTRSPRVVRGNQVLADYLTWEADGSGVYYYKAVDKQRRGISSETGLVVVEQAYTALTPSFHPLRPGRLTSRRPSEEVAPAVLPAGFPVVDHRAGASLSDPVLEALSLDQPVEAQSLQAAELPPELYSFRVTSPRHLPGLGRRPRCNATSQQAKYKVVHNGVTEYKTVNQNAYYDAWVPLGTFAFTGAGGEYVELTDATGESYTTKRLLGVDAIRWVRQ